MSDGTDGIDDLVAERLDGMEWPWLLAAGPAAFVAGYVATVLVVVLGPSSIGDDVFNALKQLVFVFYSAHNVPLEVSGFGRVDWLTRAASPSTPAPDTPVVVFYAIPMLVLIVTGVVVSGRLLDRVDDPVRIAAAVGALGVSYGLAAVAGALVFTDTSLVGGPARLALADAALFGLAYPLAFGTVGAGRESGPCSVSQRRKGRRRSEVIDRTVPRSTDTVRVVLDGGVQRNEFAEHEHDDAVFIGEGIDERRPRLLVHWTRVATVLIHPVGDTRVVGDA